MGRVITVVVAVASCLLIWKSGVLDSALPGSSGTPAPTADATLNISKAGDAMNSLKSVHMTVTGNLVFAGEVGIILSGTGDLVYPHKENLSLQYKVPTRNGDLVVPINIKIEGGHEYVQEPGKPWQDVSGAGKGVVAPGMDPIANLEFIHAFRAADDLGDITMDGVDVHHFTLTVDAAKYVSQLKADPNSVISPTDEAELTNADIHVDIWIAAADHYVHQMRVQVDTTGYTWDLTYHFSEFQTNSQTNSA